MSVIRLNTNSVPVAEMLEDTEVQGFYSYNGFNQSFKAGISNVAIGITLAKEKNLKAYLQEAHLIAKSIYDSLYVSKTIEIEYEGILIHVRYSSDIKGLMVDYTRAKAGIINSPIGPFSNAELSEEEKEADDLFLQEKANKVKNTLVKQLPEVNSVDDNFNSKLKKILEPTVKMSRNEVVWTNAFINADKKTQKAMAFAETFARLIETEFAKGEALNDIAEEYLQKTNDVFNVNKSVVDNAIEILLDVWKYKKQLRKWTNETKK